MDSMTLTTLAKSKKILKAKLEEILIDSKNLHNLTAQNLYFISNALAQENQKESLEALLYIFINNQRADGQFPYGFTKSGKPKYGIIPGMDNRESNLYVFMAMDKFISSFKENNFLVENFEKISNAMHITSSFRAKKSNLLENSLLTGYQYPVFNFGKTFYLNSLFAYAIKSYSVLADNFGDYEEKKQAMNLNYKVRKEIDEEFFREGMYYSKKDSKIIDFPGIFLLILGENTLEEKDKLVLENIKNKYNIADFGKTNTPKYKFPKTISLTRNMKALNSNAFYPWIGALACKSFKLLDDKKTAEFTLSHISALIGENLPEWIDNNEKQGKNESLITSSALIDAIKYIYRKN